MRKMEYKRKEIIGGCTLYLGDCLEVMPTLGKVDAVVTDPPYLVDTQGGGCFGKRKYKAEIRAANIDKGFDFSFLNSELCDSVICFMHDRQLHELAPHFAKNFDKQTLCYWHKSNAMPVANMNYQPEVEIYIHAWNKGFYPTGNLSQLKRVFSYPVGKSDFDHPTVKPLPLMEKIIRNVNGQTILDPFVGSGTTGVACVKLGRKFIGIELEEKYFDIACKRIKEAYDQPDMFVPPPVKYMQDDLL